MLEALLQLNYVLIFVAAAMSAAMVGLWVVVSQSSPFAPAPVATGGGLETDLRSCALAYTQRWTLFNATATNPEPLRRSLSSSLHGSDGESPVVDHNKASGGVASTRQTIAGGEASQQYATAHVAHYGTQDLSRALHLYDRLIASHPSSPEAAYASTQVRNIVNIVVPKHKFIQSQIDLAFRYLKNPNVG